MRVSKILGSGVGTGQDFDRQGSPPQTTSPATIMTSISATASPRWPAHDSDTVTTSLEEQPSADPECGEISLNISATGSEFGAENPHPIPPSAKSSERKACCRFRRPPRRWGPREERGTLQRASPHQALGRVRLNTTTGTCASQRYLQSAPVKAAIYKRR